MRVLVTGGLGYLGSHVVQRLLAGGDEVVVFDAEIYPRMVSYPEHPGLHVVRGDLRAQELLARTADGTDAVLHLAAIVGDEACNLDPEGAVGVNYLTTRYLASQCAAAQWPMIFTSTCSVYGAKGGEIRETDDVTPLSIYGMSKLAAEEAVRGSTPNSTVVRFGTLFGLSERMRFDLVINRLIGQAMQDGRISVFGGDQWRPFLHVQDAADALVKVLHNPKPGMYNLGGANFRIREVAAEIASQISCEVTTYSELKDRRTYYVNSDLAIEAFGVQFDRGIQTAISEIESAVRGGKILDYRDPSFSNVAWLRKKAAG